MLFKHLYLVFSECYKIAGWSGLKSFVKYLCGSITLAELSDNNSISQDGDIYA